MNFLLVGPSRSTPIVGLVPCRVSVPGSRGQGGASERMQRWDAASKSRNGRGRF